VKDQSNKGNHPEPDAGKQFSFGAKRHVPRRVGRLFAPQKGWNSPLFDFQPDSPRSIMRVVSKYS
jgi:hypothetical protein